MHMNKNNRKEQEKQNEDERLQDIIAAGSERAAAYRRAAEAGSVRAAGTFDRSRWEDKAKLARIHNDLKNGKTCVSETDGRVMHTNIQAAKNKLGERAWSGRVPEIDHVVPLKKCWEMSGNNPLSRYVSAEKAREFANSDGNLQIIDKQSNTRKGAMTNREYVQKQGASMSGAEKSAWIEKGDAAEKSIRRNLVREGMKGLVKETADEIKEYGSYVVAEAGIEAVTDYRRKRKYGYTRKQAAKSAVKSAGNFLKKAAPLIVTTVVVEKGVNLIADMISNR